MPGFGQLRAAPYLQRRVFFLSSFCVHGSPLCKLFSSLQMWFWGSHTFALHKVLCPHTLKIERMLLGSMHVSP